MPLQPAWEPERTPQGGRLKAAFLTGPGRIESRDTDEPSREPGDVVLRVESVGICGTDLSIHAGKIPVDYPRVMGHEIVGTVHEAGSGIDEGTKVLVDPGIACGQCRQCREGRTNICTRGWLIGRDLDGGLRELMTVPASNLHPLPKGLDPASASMIQVLATCVHAQSRGQVSPDESVVVLGLGVTGLLHLQLAKLRGCYPVIGITRSAPKLALARALGADLTIAADGSETGEVDAVIPGGADLVIECVGTVEAFARAMEMVRTVVLTGKRATLAPWFQEFDEADERRAAALLERVGCGHLAARRFATGSQGERQRVLLARALFSEPELLILDEPASGLDLPAREALIEALEAVAAQPSAPTTIVATHHLEEIPPAATHAALLRDGRMIASGEIDRVLVPEALERCFGIAMQIGRRGGRWWAVAGPRPAGRLST